MRGFLAKLCKKNGIAKRIVSMSLALLMVLSTLQALPAGILVAHATENTYGVKLHFQENSWTANSMYAYAWNNSGQHVAGAWPGSAMADIDSDQWYDIELSFTEAELSGGNLNFKFTDNKGNENGNNLKYQLTAGQTTELWICNGKSANTGTIVTSKPTGSSWTGNITMHYKNIEGWSNVYAYMWDGTGELNGGWSGNQSGAVLPAQSKNETNKSKGWWDVTFDNLTVRDGLLKLIFNNADDSMKTMDLYFVPTGIEVELWVTEGKNSTSANITTTAPSDWSTGASGGGGNQEPAPEPLTQQTVTVHFQDSEEWDKDNDVVVYLGKSSSFGTLSYNSATVYKYANGWPGAVVEADPDNAGWYSFKITTDPCELGIIFNNNKNGKQTENIYITPDEEESEVWITLTGNEGNRPVAVTETAPNGWVANTKTINPPVDPYANVSYDSPVVNDDGTITFNLAKGEYNSAEVMGSIPGCSWTPNNEETGWMMELDGDVYTYTTATGIAPGAYEYKFVVNGDAKDGWMTDPLNSKYSADGKNSLVIVSGMYSKEALTAEKGKDFSLPSTLTYVAENGTEEPKSVTYKLKDTTDANVTLTNGKLKVAAASTLTSVDVIATATDNTELTATLTVKLNAAGVEVLKSPVVNGTTVTFNYEDTTGKATSVKLTGSEWGWSGEGIEMTKAQGSNVFSSVQTMAPGKYTYKFIVGSDWIKDPLNSATEDDGHNGLNSVLIVPGLRTSTLQAKKGANYELPTTLECIDAKGESSQKSVTYKLKNDADASFATITDGTILKATEGCTETSVDLVVTASTGETSVVTVELVDNLYTYTVYAYSPIEGRVNVNNSALWIWDKAGETSLKDAEYAFTTTEKLSDGRTWLKAEIKLSCSESIGFILKSKDSWDWQTADLIFGNTEKTDQTIYLVDGFDKVYTSLDEVPTISQLCIEYTRSDNNYKNPYVEVWGDGYGTKENLTYQFDNSTGKYIVNIPIALGTKDKTVGFNVYNDGNIDGAANSVVIKAGEKLTKVKFAGGAITNTVPDSSSYVADREKNKISFYYRDEALFLENKMHTINTVQLAIRKAVGDAAVTAETRINMTYDANDERFELENQELPDDSDIYYYFIVDGNIALDVKNDRRTTIDNTEYCVVRNRVYNINLNASVKYSEMTYDDGNVLYVKFDEVEGFNPETVTADLSSLGLGSKVEVNKELMALSFGCLEGTSIGPKAINVTLVDDCDVTYKAIATVNVKARTKTDNTDSKLGTFDWDEAVIYFAVTDRFFDGNANNNTGDPNSTADDAAYNPDDMGSYHGGDFAGLTQKIDYLYDLGVNTIWLTPIVDNVDENYTSDELEGTCDYYAYHGYWASDFTKLNPHLGNSDELTALINAAHAKGMKIMVDVVVNHGGYGKEDYFDSIIPGTQMVRDAEHTEAGDIKASLSGLPDFMTEDPKVREQLIEWQTYWMTQYDIDYYRVDTVKHVENTTWNAFKNALVEQNQDFKLIGEYYDAGYLNDFEQLDTGRMDSVLDFNFNDLMLKLVDEDLAGIEKALGERNTMLTNTATVGSFTSSHDEDGLLYTMSQKEDANWAKALMKVAATYQATAKGQPVIYYGEEIGMTGTKEWPYYTNRLDFNWTEQATQAADDNSMYNHYKKVLNIRRDYSEVFAKGDRTPIASGEGYEIFSRSYGTERLYVAVNVWGNDAEAKFFVPGAEGSVYTDLYSNKTYKVAADGSITVTIPGAGQGGSAILVGDGVTVEDTNEITVKIHYTRDDGKYEGWNLWAWTETGLPSAQYDFVKEGNEMVATVSGIPGRSTTRLCYLTRLNEWEAKDYGSDQYIDLSDIVSGTVHYYINSSRTGGTRVLGSDAIVGKKIVSTAYNRNTNTITVNMSAPIAGSAEDAFTIKCTSTNTAIDITSAEKNGKQYFLTIDQDISSLEALLLSYTITYDGYTYNLMTPNLYSSEEFEDAYAYSGTDLGLTYTADASTFKLWAPTADSVTLNIYTSGTKGTDDLLGSYVMTGGTKDDKGVWTYVLDGDWNGKYYTYTVEVNNSENEVCDPYARTTGVNGNRAMILDLDSTNPEGWDEDKNAKRHDGMNYTDAVIYELHVRDLTIDDSSGVSDANQGKFLGLTETGTTTAGGNPTALDHMINLGITHLHLIPVYDYGSVDETKLDTEQFNWGYDPVNYNVPEGSYSTNPYDGSVRVAEMKQMIKTLHDNNINVVMDVVYNHVYDAESFAFNQVVPKYFSRTNDDGTYSNGSGCGNDTASERAMVHKYIVDSILYWHNEYHIDGFRFDLVGLIDTVTINKLVADVHAVDPDIIFYGEGWTMGTAVSKDNYIMSTQANAKETPGFAYFSDTIRNGVAGDNIKGDGYIWGTSGKDTLVSQLTLAQSSWTQNPSQTINYVSCHDNYTLMDKINKVSNANVTSYNYTPGEYQVALNNLSAAVYMFSEGIPFIHAGEDFLRIKIDETGEVIHNSYNSPDYVNQLRWSNLDKDIYKDTTDYYKGLIEFRKNHAALRLATADLVSANVTSKVHSSGVIVNTFNGDVNGEVADGIVTIFNATNSAVTISNNYGITSGTEWKVCVNKEDAGTDVLATITNGSVTVEPYSVMALVKGETVDTNSIYAKNNSVTITLDKESVVTGIDTEFAITATVNPENATLKWTTSDETVATVDETGKVTALAAGKATITVSTLHGVEKSCEVTVTTGEGTIAINKTVMSLEEGLSETLVVTVSPEDTVVTYTSSNPSVATVDSTGKVTAVSAGTATITVAIDEETSVSCTITVTAKPAPAPTPTPTPTPVPSTPSTDATTGATNGATAGVNPKPSTGTTTTKPEEDTKVEVEVETDAATEVPETVTDITPVVDEKLQNAIGKEAEKILEDIINDEISEEVMSEETLANVKEAQEDGESIITEVIVDKLDEANVEADVKEALEKALTESVKDKKGAETKIAQYLDLTVLLKTTSGQKLGEINKLSKDMTFTIAVPEELVKEGRVFVVLRMHEGETTVLETTMNSDGTLSFKTDRFSTYALAYVDAPAEEVTDDDTTTEGDVPSGSTTTEEEGGNNVATFIIVGLIIVIIAALVIIFLAMKRKKDE